MKRTNGVERMKLMSKSVNVRTYNNTKLHREVVSGAHLKRTSSWSLIDPLRQHYLDYNTGAGCYIVQTSYIAQQFLENFPEDYAGILKPPIIKYKCSNKFDKIWLRQQWGKSLLVVNLTTSEISVPKTTLSMAWKNIKEIMSNPVW